MGDYTVTETIDETVTGWQVENYTLETTYSVGNGTTTVSKNDTAEMTVTNTYTQDKGKLKVYKTITGDLSAGDLTTAQKQAIKFTVTDSSGATITNGTFTFADGRFSNPGYVLFEDLPVGNYTVTETIDETVTGWQVEVSTQQSAYPIMYFYYPSPGRAGEWIILS